MKSTSKLFTLYPVFVLTLGLISCSPEQKQDKDHFRIQEPEFIAGKAKAIKFTQLEHQTIWNVEDQIRFQEADRSGLQLSLRSTCKSMLSNEVYESVQTRPLPRELFIGEILPPTLLTRKNPQGLTQFQCSFAFAAINSKGSQHKFQLPARLLEEQPLVGRNTSLQINGTNIETKPNEWPMFNSAELEKFWVMSPRADRFQLRCNDLKASLYAKADFVSITEILKTVEAEQIQTSIQRSPEQTCRILSYQNEVLQGWSSYFRITWSDSKLNIQHQRHLAPIYWASGVHGTHHKVYEVKIKNPYTFPVYFSIPEQREITTLHMLQNNSGQKFKLPFSISYDKTTTGLILNEKKPFRIGLNAGAQIILSINVQMLRKCGAKEIGYAFPFQSLSILQLKRFENMTDDLEIGRQDLVPRKLIGISNSQVNGFNPSIPEDFNPPEC